MYVKYAILLMFSIVIPAVAGCSNGGDDEDASPDPTTEPTPTVDADGDTYSPSEGDCDDANAVVNPGVGESCNGIDDNCNGVVDDIASERPFYPDTDGDGFGALAGAIYQTQCTPSPGYVAQTGDCNDRDSTIYPGAQELANGIDDNCDGVVDEGTVNWDNDGDGYSVADGDCDDTNAYLSPDQAEWFNHVDDDCDGEADEGINYVDNDGDNYSEAECDCDDTNPAVAWYLSEDPTDGIDNNCDGSIDETTSTPHTDPPNTPVEPTPAPN